MAGEGVPTSPGVMHGEALHPIDHTARGLEAMVDRLGFSLEDAAQLGAVQLDYGGECKGNVAEFFGRPEHDRAIAKFGGAVALARERGDDASAAVIAGMGLAVDRDESGDVIRQDMDILKKK